MILTAFKAQLARLAADPRDPFAAKVRKRVGAREAVQYVRQLRSLILATPEMAGQLGVWSETEDIPPKWRRLSTRALTLLYRPIVQVDPGEGLFVYFGDAYLVGTVYELIVQQVAEATPRLLRETEVAPQQIPQWLESARVVFPDVTARIGQTFLA